MSNDTQIAEESYSVSYRPVQYDGHQFFVPGYALHRPACKKLLNGQLYEPLTHRLMQILLPLRQGDLVHAGTFFGDMLPTFAAACTGRVYGFEPVLESYTLAKLCLIHNKIENVALFNAALGASLGIVHVDVGDQNTHRGGSSKVADEGQVTTLMPVDCLGIERLAVLQLDVEGFEYPALEGAEQTIARCRPIIMVEDNKHSCAAFLEPRGYLHVGRVPGLEIWCDKIDRTQVETAIATVTGKGVS